MLDVILKVLSFAVIIVVGIFAARSGKFGAGADRLISKIVFNLTLPCAIIRAFTTSDFNPALLGLIPVGLLACVIPFSLSLLAYRNKPREERIVQQSNVCGMNIGCFGLAFVQAFFPATAGVATCLFDAGNSLMCTGGTWALVRALVLNNDYADPRDRTRVFLKALLRSVPFDCYVILVAMSIMGIKIPAQVAILIEPIANANGFLAMFMIGLMVRFHVSESGVRELRRLITWRACTSLALCLTAMFLLPFGHEVKTVIAVLAWSPAPATGPLYTMWAKGDVGLASMANAITILIGITVMTTLVILLGVY